MIPRSVGDEHGCEFSYSRSARSAGSEAAGAHYWQRGRHYTHGTYYSYTHGACRCTACREANRIACWLRRNGLAPGRLPLRHGTTSLYNKGCRCDACKDAQKARRDRHWQGGLHDLEQVLREHYPAASSRDLSLTARGLAPFPLRDGPNVP